MAGNIFLNYRRGDDPGTAGRIFDRLEREFGNHAVFMDVEGRIKPGDDYVTVLRSQVAACDVVLAVIGPRWLTVTDGDGRRRLDNADDWVRVEIASALEAGDAKRVIPVLVGGASMPRAEELPDDLKELTRKQTVRVTLERFQADTHGLITEVRRVLANLEVAQRAAAAKAKAQAEAAARRNREERRRARRERLPSSRAMRLVALGLAVVAGVAAAGLSYHPQIAAWLRSERRAPGATSAPAGPQDFLRSIVVASNGECPAGDLVRLPGLGSQERLLKGLGFTYVLQATTLRRTSSRVSDWIYSAKPLLFEPVVIYGRDTVSKSLLVSIKDTTNVRRCGWLDEDAALFDPDKSLREYAFGPKPIQVKDGPDGRSNPYNTLDLKVVLQNLNRDGQDGAPILTLPGESTRAPSLKRLKLFSIFEVFAWKNTADPDNDRETRTYYLIGRSNEPSVGGRLDGWVHEDDVSHLGRLLIAAYWAGTGEARGYLRKDLLASTNYVVSEPPQGPFGEPLDRSPLRFPVLAQEPHTAEIIRQKGNHTSAPKV